MGLELSYLFLELKDQYCADANSIVKALPPALSPVNDYSKTLVLLLPIYVLSLSKCPQMESSSIVLYQTTLTSYKQAKYFSFVASSNV